MAGTEAKPSAAAAAEVAALKETARVAEAEGPSEAGAATGVADRAKRPTGQQAEKAARAPMEARERAAVKVEKPVPEATHASRTLNSYASRQILRLTRTESS
jgi:hypothetical protein